MCFYRYWVCVAGKSASSVWPILLLHSCHSLLLFWIFKTHISWCVSFPQIRQLFIETVVFDTICFSMVDIFTDSQSSLAETQRLYTVGTFPVVALMVGNAVTRISSTNSVCDDSGNSTSGNSSTSTNSDPCFQTGCESLAVDIAVTLSFLVGVLMVRAMRYIVYR